LLQSDALEVPVSADRKGVSTIANSRSISARCGMAGWWR
jgi:hypothetical protein